MTEAPRKLEDQPDTLAMIEKAFGGARDILMNGTTMRYLSDHIEELIDARVAVAWQASRQQALEEAAKAVDALRDDAKEAEVHAKWRAAEADGSSESLQLAHASFWSTVSTVNGVLGRAAKAIRSLTPTKGPTP